jgi:hypothetical protein
MRALRATIPIVMVSPPCFPFGLAALLSFAALILQTPQATPHIRRRGRNLRVTAIVVAERRSNAPLSRGFRKFGEIRFSPEGLSRQASGAVVTGGGGGGGGSRVGVDWAARLVLVARRVSLSANLACVPPTCASSLVDRRGAAR